MCSIYRNSQLVKNIPRIYQRIVLCINFMGVIEVKVYKMHKKIKLTCGPQLPHRDVDQAKKGVCIRNEIVWIIIMGLLYDLVDNYCGFIPADCDTC